MQKQHNVTMISGKSNLNKNAYQHKSDSVYI